MRVAVVGATGAVGRELLLILQQRDFKLDDLRLLASERSSGMKIPFGGVELPVETLDEKRFDGVDLAFFCVEADVSKRFVPVALERGAFVIDKSSAFRLKPEVPLIVPEVNLDSIGKSRLVANPNCSTIILVVAVAPLLRKFGIRRIVVCTYQAASGAGSAAMSELKSQTEEVLKGGEPKPVVFPHPIAFNLFPHIDSFLENGYTKEEMKMVDETKKILGDKRILISSTCVRVPVFRAHSEAVHIELKQEASVEEVRAVLEKAEGVSLMDKVEENLYPTPLFASGKDKVFVGRIRRDLAFKNGIAMWVVSDQLRKGAVLNAIQIAERVFNKKKKQRGGK
ncbi:MAG: aspartate-semialdehyde dehydrogenase [Planctomycetota bacterium]|nr:aspartate-semialdehyde dehydrogenase [Planctomycetota bacterium]